MAFDKNQLVMHQLQVKSKRLDSGLSRLIGALKVSKALANGDEALMDAYYYALGCLGGDHLKKELFDTDAFEVVVMQLKESKFMKADVADKNIELWREKHQKKEGAEEVVTPETEKSVTEKKEPVAPKMFGELDEEGHLVPRKGTVICEYEKPQMMDRYGNPISERTVQASGVHKPIYCY